MRERESAREREREREKEEGTEEVSNTPRRDTCSETATF